MNGKVSNTTGIILLFLTGLGGMAGGIGLMLNPSGTSLGMSVNMLADSPFVDYFYPGLLLFVVIGAGHFFGGFLSVLNPGIAGKIYVVCGMALTVWIIVQVLMIGLVSPLQPLFFLIGLAEAVSGLKLMKNF